MYSEEGESKVSFTSENIGKSVPSNQIFLDMYPRNTRALASEMITLKFHLFKLGHNVSLIRHPTGHGFDPRSGHIFHRDLVMK